MTRRTLSALALAALLAGGTAVALGPMVADAQAPQFDAVANVMRDNAKAMGDAARSLRGDPNQPRTALTRLEARAKFAQLHADGEAKMLAAFRPLYQAMG